MTSLHGLGGVAAHAALTSDRVEADAIYVASVDGTPRRFGAGTLPGLRYPWFKWFDPARSVPLPPASSTAVYLLSELQGPPPIGNLTGCLGAPDGSGEVVMDGERVRDACAAGLLTDNSLGATFDGVARIDAVQAPPTAAAGDTLETRLVWQPLAAHPTPEQVSLQLDDPSVGDGTLWGNGTLELYPANEWQTDESLLSRVPVQTDATALPQAYRLTVGMSPPQANAAPALAVWQGSRADRVPVSTVALSPGSARAGAALPSDMRAVEGPATGQWRAAADRLAAASRTRWRQVVRSASACCGGQAAMRRAPQLRVLLVRASGEVVQDTALPLLGGRVSPATLHTGNVVRDEQNVVVDSRAPAEALSVEVAVDDAEPVRLGSLQVTGRPHVMDDSGQAPLATFGSSMQLLAATLEPGQVPPGGAGRKVTLKLRWRAGAPMSVAYKVFVHVLDPTGQQVLAQRDAEPQDGKAPTTSWVAGEALDDAYEVALPAGMVTGEYPVELLLGVYDARSGERLTLASGDNHLVLSTPLRVQ